MKVTFASPVSMFVRAGKQLTEIKLAEANIYKVTYYPDNKVAHVELEEMPGNNLLLWAGADYDAAGEWTDADTIARIKDPVLLEQIETGPSNVSKAERDAARAK